MNLAPTDPLVVRLTAAVQSGALGELARLLDEQPELAKARIAGRRGGWGTPLHIATNWPGYFPNGPAVVRLLIEAGADPSAPCDDGPSETPLHWAASSDDVEVAAALIDGAGWREAVVRLDRDLIVNVSHRGVVSLPVVAVGPGVDSIVRRIAEASLGFYQELLELNDD
jgi:hypothetical protein